MSNEIVRVSELSIDSLPGISNGYAITDLSPSINIVYGANGCGKTSTRLALETALWPDAVDKNRLLHTRLSARYSLKDSDAADGRHITVSFGTYRTESLATGEAVNEISGGEIRERYHLSLHDLVSDTGAQFAEQITREIAGGFNLDACAAEIDARPRVTTNRKLLSSHEQIVSEIKSLQKAAEDAVNQEGELDRLEQECERLKAMGRHAKTAELALRFAKTEGDLRDISEKLKLFPTQMQFIQGNEAERLKVISEEITEATSQLASLEDEQQKLENEISKFSHASALSSADQIALRQLSKNIEGLTAALTAAKRDLAEANEAYHQALAGVFTDDALEKLTGGSLEEYVETGAAAEKIEFDSSLVDQMDLWVSEVAAYKRDIREIEDQLTTVSAEASSMEDQVLALVNKYLPDAYSPRRSSNEVIQGALDRIQQGVNYLRDWLIADAHGSHHDEIAASASPLSSSQASSSHREGAIYLEGSQHREWSKHPLTYLMALMLVAQGLYFGFSLPIKDAVARLTSAIAFPAIALVVIVIYYFLIRRQPEDRDGVRGDANADAPHGVLSGPALQRDVFQERFENLAIVTPQSWQHRDVLNLYNELLKDVTRILQLATECKNARSKGESLALRKTHKSELLDGLKAEIASALNSVNLRGFDVDSIHSTGVLIRSLDRIMHAAQERAVRLGAVKNAKGNLNKCISEAVSVLNKSGGVYDGDETPNHVLACIEDTLSAVDGYRSTAVRLESLSETILRLKDHLSRTLQQRKELFASVHLEESKADRLESLTAMCKDFRNITAEYEGLKKNRESDLIKLEQDPLLASLDSLAQLNYGGPWRELSIEQLAELCDNIYKSSSDLTECVEAKSRLSEKIKTDRKSDELEAKQVEKARLLEEINTHRMAELEAVLGNIIVEHVRKDTEDDHKPQVLLRAEQLFGIITRGNFSLQVRDSGFVVRDSLSGGLVRLENLSCGTKVQLQLAVKLAFVEVQERGRKYPLFLDEALGTSDDVRAQAIIDTVVALIKDGRQVFYFTAQSDEVMRWITSLNNAGLEYRAIDLEAVRLNTTPLGLESSRQVSLMQGMNIQAPEPGETHFDYGIRLQIHPPQFRLDQIGNTSIWYVIHDPVSLYEAYKKGIHSIATLRAYLNYGGALPIAELDNLRRSVEVCWLALQAYTEALSIGQGKLVTPAILNESPAGRSKLLPEIIERAHEFNGVGRSFMESLRTRRIQNMQTRVIDSLEDYLREAGCIVDDESLSDDEVRAFVRASVDRARNSSGNSSGNSAINITDNREDESSDHILAAFIEKLLNPPVVNAYANQL